MQSGPGRESLTTGTETLKQPMDVLKRFQDRMPMPLWLPDSVFAMEQGCGQDHEKACSCFRFARSKSMEARANYGEMLTMGTGCVRDVIKGIKELELAAAHDIPYANLCLGRLQFNGTLMKKNTGSGMRHLRIAAEAELPAAQYIVGYILFNGLEGITRNRYQGLRYINLAASAGNLKAKKTASEDRMMPAEAETIHLPAKVLVN